MLIPQDMLALAGPHFDFLSQLEDLATHFEFNSYSTSNILVEGNKVAAKVELNLTLRKTGDTFNTTKAHFGQSKAINQFG